MKCLRARGQRIVRLGFRRGFPVPGPPLRGVVFRATLCAGSRAALQPRVRPRDDLPLDGRGEGDEVGGEASDAHDEVFVLMGVR